MKLIIRALAIQCSVLSLLGITSCEGLADFQGNYSGTEIPADTDSAYMRILLSVAQADEGATAKIALDHFIKQTYLYSDIAETNVFKVDKDTLTLSFTIPADRLSLIEAEKEERAFTITFVKQENQTLKFVRSMGDVQLDGTSLELDNVTESNPTFSIGSRKPEFIVFDESGFIYTFWGKVKSLRIKGYFNTYYTFDENGIPTGSNEYTGFHRQTDTEGITTVTTRYKNDCSGYKTTQVYDKDNRLIKGQWSTPLYHGTEEYYYDQHGRPTMRIGSNDQKRTIIFNKNGKMVYGDIVNNGDEPYVNPNLSHLTIDDHGNWLPKNWELEYYE